MKEQSVIAKLAALETASLKELQALWRNLYGTEPPSFYRPLLKLKLAHRIQELAHGGLTKETQQRLKQAMENAGAKPRLYGDRLAAGTMLVREWRGVEHRVRVLDDGFDYMGRRYKSLSAIARAITGTNWNGWMFFGLRSRRMAA
ncbi:MAG: DUF2924 domain-containing protein [Pseudomonadota bacterium]|nr:DUF2924 domain-containing protein [Pseudomonadota bacterium]